MNQLLNKGERVRASSSGLSYEVEEFLGGGGQGEVYRAGLVDAAGAPMALKWYFPHYLRQDPEQRTRLERAIANGPPSDRFLWPQELVEIEDRDFGYVMPLREGRFVGMTELVGRRVAPSFRALVTAGFELAYHYRQLHDEGLCYRDISFGNAFFDPESGEVRICDNDNVDVNRQAGAIGGTPRFMAPEIVRGEAGPSTQTDLFSLAVLLFYMFINHHPLEGKREADIRCLDLPAMTRLYGTHPIFIFDPDDASNRPLRGSHDNALTLWPLYPRSVQELFLQTFTEGLRDPDRRAREGEWSRELIRLRDSIFYCQGCGAENFYDPTALSDSDGNKNECWSCTSPHRLPPRMRIDGGDVVMLNQDTVLYAHHLDAGRRYDIYTAAAEVVQHPQDPQIWGLRNGSAQKWTSRNADGQLNDVAPGRSVTLSSGLRIEFGNRTGEVRL